MKPNHFAKLGRSLACTIFCVTILASGSRSEAQKPGVDSKPDVEFDFGRQQVHSLTFSPDGTLLAAGGFTGEVRVWNVPQRKEVQTLKAHDEQVRVALFTPDSKTLVTADSGGTFKLWDTTDWTEQKTFEADILYAGTMSPDGTVVYVGQFGKSRSFDLATGKSEWEYPQEQGVIGVAVTPDGKHLIAASESTVALWELPGGGELLSLSPSAGGYMRCMAMSPDSSLVAVGTEQNFLIVWDLNKGEQLHAIETGRAEIITAVAFSPDNRTVVMDGEGEVRLFDAVTGERLRQLETTAADQLAVSPDGSLLATGGMTVESEGKVQLWTIGKPIKVASRQPLAADAPVRKWTSADGKFTVRAQLVKVANNVAHLKLESDGRVVEVPIDRLSAVDVRFILSRPKPRMAKPKITRPRNTKPMIKPAAPVADGPNDPKRIAELKAVGMTVYDRDGRINTVLVPKGAANDDDLARLKNLRNIKTLTITGSDVTDAGLEHLAGLTTLESLNIYDASASGTGLAHLHQIEGLKRVELSRSKITDEGAASLQSFVNLETLKLSYTEITSEAIESLTGLHELRELWLDHTKIDDQALKSLAKLDQLEILRMEHTQITGSGFAELKRLQNLKELDVGSCPVEEAHLMELRHLKKLKRLQMLEVKASRETWIELFQALPDCQIFKPPG